MTARSQLILRSCANHIIKHDWLRGQALTESSSAAPGFRLAIPQLSASHLSVVNRPAIVANGSPSSIVENLNTAFVRSAATNKTNSTILDIDAFSGLQFAFLARKAVVAFARKVVAFALAVASIQTRVR